MTSKANLKRFEKKISELKLSIKILNRSRGNWEYDHHKYSRRDWIAEVGSKDTQIGYFDWAEHKLEGELEDLTCGMNDVIARIRKRRRR